MTEAKKAVGDQSSTSDPVPGTEDAHAERQFELTANAVLDDAAPVPGTDAAPAGPPGAAWLPIMQPVVEVLRATATNWTIPKETGDQFAQALAECADQLMPGGLGNMEAWGPWAKLAFAAGMIVVPNIDMETWRIKPLRPVPPEEENTDEKTGAPAPGTGEEKRNGE